MKLVGHVACCVCLSKNLPHCTAARGLGRIALNQVTFFFSHHPSVSQSGHSTLVMRIDSGMIQCTLSSLLVGSNSPSLPIRNKQHEATLLQAAIFELRRKPALKLSWQKKEKQQELQKRGVMSWSYLKLTPSAFCIFNRVLWYNFLPWWSQCCPIPHFMPLNQDYSLCEDQMDFLF